MSDLELLHGYVQSGSQSDFAQLVERHVSLIYSTARRMVRDTHLAEDVTQEVFTLLARKAGRLGSDTILSAWLYRAARHLASETLRRENRRFSREQLAAENMNEYPPAETWRQIEPLLDEAMARLSAADHDAVVLRYFDNLSLKEVGAALGSNEDAAQKRVARALERLRTHLTHRGVTVSTAVLASAVASGAVQSAPASLAASVASASLASAVGISFTAQSFHVMTTTNFKLISTAVVIATFSVSLALLYRQNQHLRRELATLRASALETGNSSAKNSSAAEPKISDDELQRRRKEYLELLSLRGQVALLANELRERKSSGNASRSGRNPALDEKAADSIILTATSSTNHVTSGHTLVVGGWPMLGGRGYLLITPVIGEGDAASDDRTIAFQGQIIRAPESFWNEIGWGAYKSDTRRSTLSGELTPEQVDFLVQALKEARGTQILNLSPTVIPDGKRTGYGFSTDDHDGTGGLVMGVDFYPRIRPDRLSVDLEIIPTPVSADIPIHSSLK